MNEEIKPKSRIKNYVSEHKVGIAATAGVIVGWTLRHQLHKTAVREWNQFLTDKGLWNEFYTF